MTLSFIICTYNRDKYIYQCLSRLAANSHQDDWEIILVDNHSSDDTAVQCQRFATDYSWVNYHYFVEMQQGLSFARNRGIKEANGEWLVFLDDDAMVESDYVNHLLDLLRQYPEAGAFGGQITPFFEEKEPEWMSRWTMGFVSAIDMGEKVCVFPRGKFPIGANMGIARSVIRQIGVFNTALGRTKETLLGGEEKDLFLRIQAKDISVLYFPGIKVQHCIPPRRTTKEFIQRLGYGVGRSERLRTLGFGKLEYVKRVCLEFLKWGATMLLWCFFLLKGTPAKGNILVTFRCQVSKGLFSNGVL